jgi:hypothetical protein
VSPPGLAGLAVRRGELASAAVAGLVAAPWRRRVLLVSALLWVGVAALEFATRNPVLGAAAVALLALTALGPRLERRGLDRMRRGVEINRRFCSGPG